MSLWSRITGANSANSAAGRTHREKVRRSREIRKIDANTSRWQQAGGLAPKKRK